MLLILIVPMLCSHSCFQERVLFLITQPTSGGDVERFFSQCGTASKRQHKLEVNIRRLRFMLQFHDEFHCSATCGTSSLKPNRGYWSMECGVS